MVAQRRTGSMMRRSFPPMHMILVAIVWVETRVSMGYRLEVCIGMEAGFGFLLSHGFGETSSPRADRVTR